MPKLVSSHPDIASVFETKNRREFIKLCNIIAKGLDVGARATTTIAIAGKFDAGKSLVADAIIHALDDSLRETKQSYAVPHADKMMFENKPAEALNHAVRGYVIHKGQKIEIIFVRSPYDIPKQDKMGPYLPRLVFLSHNDSVVAQYSDLLVTIDEHYARKHLGNFVRNWDIIITSKNLFHDTMQNTIKQVKSIHARRSHKESLKQ